MPIALALDVLLASSFFSGPLLVVGLLVAGVLKKRGPGKLLLVLSALALTVAIVSLVSVLVSFGRGIEACDVYTNCLESQLEAVDRSCETSRDY